MFCRNGKKRILALLLALICLFIATACGRGRASASGLPPLHLNIADQEIGAAFSTLPSAELSLSQAGADAVLKTVEQQQANYAYAYLYQLEQVKSRLDFDAAVAEHSFCALNGEQKLDGRHLSQLVLQNNQAFLSAKPFGYTAVKESDVAAVCTFIAAVIHQMAEKYPEIDWARVYCNLGNLKIVYKNGTLSYAQVTKDMVLVLSEYNNNALLNMKGENAFSRVLVHEIMHLMQMGCVCEQIPHCERRAGISVYWDDFPLNATDWPWFVEGSAERNMCNLT